MGAEPPVAARLEEVGVVGGVVAPAQGRLDPRHRQPQSPDGLRPSDLPLGVKHPVVLTYTEKQKKVAFSLSKGAKREKVSQFKVFKLDYISF